MFYVVKKERKRDRNTHPLPTLVDIPVPVGEMVRLSLLPCFGVQAATWGTAVPVRCKPAFCGSTMAQGTRDGRTRVSIGHEALSCRHTLHASSSRGSQLSQLNLQRNVLLFGELPDNTHTLKCFSIPAGQLKEPPVSGQEPHPLQSILLRCG